MARTEIALIGALLLAACGAPPPPPPLVAPAAPAAVAPAAPALALPAPAAKAAAPPAAEAPLAIPAGAVYACVVDAAGERRVTAIEFATKVAELCARHPEMGPCQYERAACRHGGGRVFAADGREITLATEAAYDKRVLHIRLKSN